MTRPGWNTLRQRADFFRGRVARVIDVDAMDPSLPRIEATVAAIMDDLGQVDPVDLHAQLTLACAEEPARMAQVLMCAVAYVDPDEHRSTREARVDRIAYGDHQDTA